MDTSELVHVLLLWGMLTQSRERFCNTYIRFINDS